MNVTSRQEMQHGLIFNCDINGTVLEVVRDDIGIELEPPFLFTRLIDRNSLGKALSFLAELHKAGTVLDWELVLYNSPRVLHFSGIASENQTFIIASENSQETQRLFEELMKMTNEQATLIRNYIKRDAIEPSLYEEISRLNNELVTVQRELAKKNAELEFINTEKINFSVWQPMICGIPSMGFCFSAIILHQSSITKII